MISKSKKNYTFRESNISSNNQKCSLDSKLKITQTNENDNINIRGRSKFHEKELIKFTKFSSINPKDKKLLSAIQESEKEENINEIKENKKKINYKNDIGNKIYNKIKKSENKNENENIIILTSSMNAINELEKDNISKNKLELLNKKENNISKTNISNNCDNEKNNRCIIS